VCRMKRGLESWVAALEGRPQKGYTSFEKKSPNQAFRAVSEDFADDSQVFKR
jgi:hypothetical protein